LDCFLLKMALLSKASKECQRYQLGRFKAATIVKIYKNVAPQQQCMLAFL